MEILIMTSQRLEVEHGCTLQILLQVRKPDLQVINHDIGNILNLLSPRFLLWKDGGQTLARGTL